METAVRDLSGMTVGTVLLRDDIFALPFNEPLVHQALLAQRANRRQGTAATKSRGQVAGGGRKQRPQKHTGRSRQGSSRAPHWRGGGVAFGPHPRDYRQALPRKMRRQAIRCALSAKGREGRLVVVQDLALQEGKTKEMAQALQALGVERKALIATTASDTPAIRAAKNLPAVRTLPARQLNVADLVDYEVLILPLEAVRVVEEIFNPQRERLRRRDKQGTQEE